MTVFGHPVAVEHPDDAVVLDAVKGRPDGEANQKVVDVDVEEVGRADENAQQRELAPAHRPALAPTVQVVADVDQRQESCQRAHAGARGGERFGRDQGQPGQISAAQQIVAVVRADQDEGHVPGIRQGPVQPRRHRADGPRFGVIDAHEAVVLHHQVPDVPHRNKKQQPVQIPCVEPQGAGENDRRSKQEPPPIAGEQFMVAVRAQKGREMMSKGENRQQDDSDLLRAEPSAHRQECRDGHQRRTDEQQRVADRAEDPGGTGLARRGDGSACRGMRG